jgi:hypothetical protein
MKKQLKGNWDKTKAEEKKYHLIVTEKLASRLLPIWSKKLNNIYSM